MTRKFQMIIFTTIFIFLFFIMFLVYSITNFLPLSEEDIKQGKEKRAELLYKIDHDALLQACRKLLDDTTKGKWMRQTYEIKLQPHPDSSKLPTEILSLEPTYIVIQEHNIFIEMHGGMDHFGFIAYSENFIESHKGNSLGDRQIIKGLWYHDDGYRVDPKYDEVIEAMKPEEETTN